METNNDDRYRPFTDDERAASTKTAANENWELAGPCPDGTPPPTFPWMFKRAPDECFAFHDASGKVLSYELHWRPAGGKKEIRPASWCKNQRTRQCEWRPRGLAKPRPLFNLHELVGTPGKPVLIFEGCRKAHRAAALFPDYICTALPFGARGASGCDLLPLQGRKVIVWPDADEPGEAFAHDVGHALGGRADVHFIKPEEVYRVCAPDAEAVPAGWDIVDALDTELPADEIARLALEHVVKLNINAERPDGRTFIKVGSATLTPARGLIMQVVKGKGDNQTVEDVQVSGPFEVLGSSRDTDGNDWGLYLGWKDQDCREHTACVSRSETFQDAKKATTKLVADGFPLTFGRERMFAQFLSWLRPKRRVTEVTNTGWHRVGDRLVFVLPDETFGNADAEIVRLKTTSVANNYARRGTLADWRDGIGCLVAPHPLLIAAVSAAFAGPLLYLTGTDGGGLHVYGSSSTGKTTLLRAAASVWGPGNSSGFIRSWHSTINGLEAAAALSSDTMLALDELGAADADEVSGAIYQLANGGGKGRALRSGDAQKAKQWRVMFMSSGEMPLVTKLIQARTKHAMAGQLSRLIDISADAGKGLGVFDTVEPCGEARLIANAITSAAGHNYGTAGPEFLRRLMIAGPDRIAERVRNDFIDPLMQSAAPNASGQVARAGQRFGVIGAAGELAIEWGICPWPKGAALAAVESLFSRWVDERGGANIAAEETQAVERVRRFLQAHGDSRFETLDYVAVGDSPVPGTVIGVRAGWREGVGKDRVWYLPREAWAEMCGDLDPRVVAEAMHARGWLRTQASGQSMTIIKKIYGQSLRVYALTAEALGETAVETDAMAA